MAGKKITKQQVKLYMKHKEDENITQGICAAKSGFSERSARTIDKGLHHTQTLYEPRSYKTRKSPIDEIWDTDLEPMLQANPDLQPTTLLIYLRRTYLDGDKPIYTDSCLRTLQRKVSKWKAINAKPKDIMIPQKHFPGEQGLSDFTHMKDIGITINAKPLGHMLYCFRLIYSKYSYAKVILSGESFQALSEGLQEALFNIGGSPKEHRSDSLSAAYKNDKHIPVEDLTDNYKQLCFHYNMKPTRNNKGKSHENGSVESSHGHIKNRIHQELILRGSKDFISLDEYEQWIYEVMKNFNHASSKNFNVEKSYLQKLPKHKSVDYEIKSIKISSLSIITIKHMKYSVPSSLQGHTITLHISQKDITGYLGAVEVFSFERKYIKDSPSKFVIDYRHIIHSLVRKPRAFKSCVYKEQLLPNQDYIDIWNYIDKSESCDVASKTILRILKLSCDYNCLDKLASICLDKISKSEAIKVEELEGIFNTSNPKLPSKVSVQHSLDNYDKLIVNAGDCHASI